MKIVVYSRHSSWEQAVRETFPEAEVWQWQPGVDNHRQADYAVFWKPPIELFQQQKKLKAAFNMGVGVDHLVNLEGLPEYFPIYKLRGVGMEEAMADYVTYGLLHFFRGFDQYRQQQQEHLWKSHRIQEKEDWPVGVLGLGVIGGAVAEHIARQGFPVSGWSRTPKQLDNVESLTGDEGFKTLLKKSRVLVSLLPATPATSKLINHDALNLLPEGAVLISGGRGSVIDFKALQSVLDSGWLRGAVMDVFEKEPLDKNCPLWDYPQVLITPHISAPTHLARAMEQIAISINQIERGELPQADIADLASGY